MINFITENNQYYKWISNKGLSIKGWYHLNEVFHQSKSTLEAFGDIKTEKEFVEVISSLNGNFAIHFKMDEFTYIAVDRIMSFPILYANVDQQVFVGDNCELILDHITNDLPSNERLSEFLATGFVTGDNTIYEEIKLIPAGKYLKINNKSNSIEIKEYFNHTHTDQFLDNMDVLCKKHSEVLDRVFTRLIESVQGKQIALFLSGGYDSRLIATMLKKLNYNNVKCISFGNIKSREVQVAKSIAESVGFEWVLLENPKSYIESIDRTSQFKKYIKITSNGFTLPYIQGVIGEKLINEGIIDKHAVFITGNSGDVLEGDQFCNKFNPGSSYTIEEIIEAILDKHFRAMGLKFSLNSSFKNLIKDNLAVNDKKLYTYEECQDIFENYNWRERQSKYVVNDIRSYDTYLSNEWRLPLWDNELVDFWLKVPTSLRANRKLYYYCVREEQLRTANVTTTFTIIRDFKKKRMMSVVKGLYPLRKLQEYFSNTTQYYGMNFETYLKLILFTKGYRTNIISTRVIWLLKNHYPKIDKETKEFITKFY